MKRVTLEMVLPVLVLSVALACTVNAQEEARDPKQNAALQYWQTFSMLPQADPKAPEVCNEKVGEQLTEATRAHVSQANLVLMRRGAAMPYCEWGLNEEDGPGVLMPHLSKARHLARIISFRFQVQAEDGKANDGVRDLAAGFAFSRHVASDGVVISFLVYCAIDSLLIERSAFFLPQLDRDHLKELAEALDQLPPGPSTADAVRSEKRVFCDWMKTRLTNELQKKEPREVFQILGLGKEQVPADWTRESVLTQLDEMSRFYDEMITLHALPLNEFHKKLPDLEARVEQAGALTRMCVPVLSRIRSKEVEIQVRLRMYRAAIDVLLEGPDVLKNYPDPYDGRPFGYKATKDGFELTSNLKSNDAPVRLRVGGKLEARAPKGDAPPKAPEF